MSGSELLAAFDDDGIPLGALPRDEVHRLGHWHEVFHCLVVAHRAGEPYAVLQRRSANKRAFPNLLDISAGGHILADETLADGVRELHEELGITPNLDDLTSLGQFRIADTDPASEGKNREIIHAFLFLDDRDLGAYAPDPVELDGVAETKLSELIAVFTEPGSLAEVTERSIDGQVRTFIAASADFVPEVDGYWTAMLATTATALAEMTSNRRE